MSVPRSQLFYESGDVSFFEKTMFEDDYPMWSLYEIIHICVAVVDESEEWSSQ